MKKIAFFLILSAGVLWGCMGAAVRELSMYGLGSMQIVSIRAILTCVVMGIVLLCYKPILFRIRWKDLWCFLGTGFCSILFFNFCYFKAIQTASLSVAAVLLYTAPSFVMILSFFLFKEKLSVRKGISLFITFAGCILVTGVFAERVQVSLQGILLGLGAGFGYALYSIFGRYALQKGYHTFTITFYTFLFASIGSVFLIDVKDMAIKATSSPMVLSLSVGVALLGTVLPYLFYTFGLSGVENGQASIIASIEPVTATILGCTIFGEPLTVSGISGVLLVILGLVVCNINPVLLGFHFGTLLNPMNGELRQEHLTYNNRVWEEYCRKRKPKFLENQQEMKSFHYGCYSKLFTRQMLPFDYEGRDLLASGNSCGVMAVYNALQVLNEEQNSFPSLLHAFETNGMVLGGNGGTAPKAIRRFFQSKGYQVMQLQNAELSQQNCLLLEQQYQVFVLTAWNHAKYMSKGMHTMCITKESEGFLLHNVDETHRAIQPTLWEAMNAYSQAPIALIGIRK